MLKEKTVEKSTTVDLIRSNSKRTYLGKLTPNQSLDIAQAITKLKNKRLVDFAEGTGSIAERPRYTFFNYSKKGKLKPGNASVIIDSYGIEINKKYAVTTVQKALKLLNLTVIKNSEANKLQKKRK